MKNTPKNDWVFGLHVKWLLENVYKLKNTLDSILARASLSLSLKQFTLPPPLYSVPQQDQISNAS